MGVRNEDHKGNPFLELLEISWATSGFMAHGLPNMTCPWPVSRNKTSKLLKMTNRYN